MNYKIIRPKLAMFDIINCEHKSLFWKLIGHTAGIYINNEINQIDVFESTQAGNFGKSGVQLNTASEWFKRYEGKKYLRKLVIDWDIINTVERGRINYLGKQFIFEMRGQKYPNLKKIDGRWKLIFAALDLEICGQDIFAYKGKDKGVFCTMLIVAWYIFSGLTKLQSDNLGYALEMAAEYEPDDMRQKGKFEKILRPGVRLTSEILVEA